MPDRYAPGHSDDRDLDQQIDRALASYADQEPDPALRTRILARAAEAAPRSRRLWLLVPAATCAAAFLIALLLHPAMHPPRPVPAAEPPTTASTASAPQSPAAVPAAPGQMIRPRSVLAAHRTRRGERPAVLRDASFPSPAPLTAQESIVLKFAMEHPAQARQVLSSLAARPIENAPLSITPIHIAALSETQQTQQWQ
jgi:hypothetical protein